MSQSLATAIIGFQRFSDSGGDSTRHETRHGSVRAPIVLENRLIHRPLLSVREPPTAVQCTPEDAILGGNVLVAQKQLPIPGSGDVWQGACPLHQSPLRPIVTSALNRLKGFGRQRTRPPLGPAGLVRPRRILAPACTQFCGAHEARRLPASAVPWLVLTYGVKESCRVTSVEDSRDPRPLSRPDIQGEAVGPISVVCLAANVSFGSSPRA
jgi:hypothetical protein